MTGSTKGVRTRVFQNLEANFQKIWPDTQGPLRKFTAPGRTEVGGNHTDHNHGLVLAAAVQLEACALIQPQDGRIELRSAGWDGAFEVDLRDLEPREEETGTTTALIRGVAWEFRSRGHKLGGFRALVESSVLPGSGLSSSAAFEVLVGSILNELYNQGRIPGQEIAIMGQGAENRHFGKPCGLMDQTASALGGLVFIDFKDPKAPLVEKITPDFADAGLTLCITDTRGDHADLTPDYAAIRGEMEEVAAVFGKRVLREVEEGEFRAQMGHLAPKISHRALLRSLHFFQENRRVKEMVACLKKGNFTGFLAQVQESGRSSAGLLQNLYSLSQPAHQAIPLGLAVTEEFLATEIREGRAACRVHGGGFAGTIQTWLPKNRLTAYIHSMEALFGPGCVIELALRSESAGELKE